MGCWIASLIAATSARVSAADSVGSNKCRLTNATACPGGGNAPPRTLWNSGASVSYAQPALSMARMTRPCRRIAFVRADIARIAGGTVATRAAAIRARPAAVFGPVEAPPCIRHRPFFIAGLLHLHPRRVLAPHRGPALGLPRGLPLRSGPGSRCTGCWAGARAVHRRSPPTAPAVEPSRGSSSRCMGCSSARGEHGRSPPTAPAVEPSRGSSSRGIGCSDARGEHGRSPPTSSPGSSRGPRPAQSRGDALPADAFSRCKGCSRVAPSGFRSAASTRAARSPFRRGSAAARSRCMGSSARGGCAAKGRATSVWISPQLMPLVPSR